MTGITLQEGERVYAAEELVAELGAAFLCADMEISGQLQHPEYIANWIKVLKDDKRAIITAASRARQAAEYLKELTGFDAEPETETENAEATAASAA